MGVLFALVHVSCGAARASQHPGSSQAAYGAPASATATSEPAPQPYPDWSRISSWPALADAAGGGAAKDGAASGGAAKDGAASGGAAKDGAASGGAEHGGAGGADTESRASRFASLGHGGGRYSYSVHVEPSRETAYRELVVERPFPADSTLWVQLFDAKSGDRGPIYVMHKSQATWEFAELNADGMIQPIAVEACRRCHAEAPTDHLFGLPRSK